MSTALLYRYDPYPAACDATVTVASDGAIHLDRTVFYAEGGGQPGDTGRLPLSGGTHVQKTGEIGAVVGTKIEKKGRLNRRVHVAFADSVPYSSPSSRPLQ